MAARDNNPLQEVVQILRRRALQIVLPALVTLSIGWFLGQLWPRTYLAQTSVEVREINAPIATGSADVRAIQRDIANAGWQIKQFERIARVLDKLEWREYREATDPVERAEFVREVSARIKTNVSGGGKQVQGSILFTVAYEDHDPQRAEQFLNQLRQVYIAETLERYRAEARRTLELLLNQKTLAQRLATEAGAAASTLKKDSGVSATQQAPGGGRQRDEDPVFRRKSDAEQQLFVADAELAVSLAEVEQIKKRLEAEPAELAQTRERGGLAFDDEVAAIERAKAEQRERQQGLRPDNSVYKNAEFKIRQLDAKLEQLLAVARAPENETRMAPNPAREQLAARLSDAELALARARARKARLEADVQALTIECNQLADVYRRLEDLDRQARIAAADLERAAENYDRQKAAVDFVNSPFADPFVLAEAARAPKDPISPNAALFVIGGLVLGLAFGLGTSLAAEFGRNGVRNAAEAERIAGAPVLGVVNRIRTRRERRELLGRRVVVVLSTVAIAASILWTTWAYQNEPQALGVSLRTALDRFREALQ
ncbi:MAG: hypothetical protein JNN27_01185 [Planctomycetes bacterium]|nr:hypothetical protein [Planctomycetota bacterium]